MDGNFSHKIKTLDPWKKGYDKPRQCIKKQRHHFADRCPYNQNYGFSKTIVMYGCESWTRKKAERQRTDAFKLWCTSRLLTARRSNQSVLKEINLEYSLKELILKFQYFGLMQRADPLERTLMLGKHWGQEERQVPEDDMIGWNHWLNGHEFEQSLGDSERQGSLVCCGPWGLKESDMT